MNRISDKYWVESDKVLNHKAEDCQHSKYPEAVLKVLAPFSNTVRRLMKYCSNCGLIMDGL